MGVNGRGDASPTCLADLAHGGRIPWWSTYIDEELPDLLLTRGERYFGRHGGRLLTIGSTNVCSSRRVGILPDDVKRRFGLPVFRKCETGPKARFTHALERT